MKPVMINTTDFPELEKSLTQEGWGNPLWSKELLEKYWGKPAEIWQHFCNWRTACKMKKGKGKGACIWLLTNIWQAACKDYHSLAIEFNRLQQERDTLRKECQNLDTRVRTLNRDMEHLQKRLLPLIEKEGIERREKLETKTRRINRAKVETALWLDPEEWDGDIWDSADESPSSEEESPSVKLRPAITHHKSEEHEGNLSGAELDEEGDDNDPSTSSKTKKGGKKGKGSKAPTHFTKITTRQYTPMELKTIQGDFAKKPEEGIIEWLVRLWDPGGGYIRLTAQETERLNLGAGIFLEHSEGNTPKTLWSLACRWVKGIYPADRDEPRVMHWTNIDKPWLAVLDVKDMFFMVPLQPADQERFAFTWRGVQYTFTRMPQGFKHSPTICHGALAKVLDDLILPPNVQTVQYIDDILIGGKTSEEVQEAMNQIKGALEALNLELPAEKCQGPSQEIKFLGTVWMGGRRSVPNDTVQELNQATSPESKDQLRQILGTLGFWRKHVPGFAIIARPLYNLLKKSAAWEWAPAHEEALRQLIGEIHTYQALGPIHPEAPFHLYLTVGATGMSYALWQESDTAPRRPIQFGSKSWQGSQANYTPYEKVLLAAYTALRETEELTQDKDITIHTPLPIIKPILEGKELPPGVAQKNDYPKMGTLHTPQGR
ncbi:unnamed protein product [Natator depressus]